MGFNFALFPCAPPGTGLGRCALLWVARGAWNEAVSDWTRAWPSLAAGDRVHLPVLAGRFTAELGQDPQDALPDDVFLAYDALYLGIEIEGHGLSSLQKIVPTPRSWGATEAGTFTVRDGLSVGGDATLGGSLAVGGGASINGDVAIEGTASAPALQLAPTPYSALPEATGREGEVRYVSDQRRLVVSDGASWQPQLGTTAAPALDCKALYDAGRRASGRYWVTGVDGALAHETECEQSLAGGGWTLIVRGDAAIDGTNPIAYYEHGFWGSLGGLADANTGSFAPAFAGALPWRSLLVVQAGTANYVQLDDAGGATAPWSGHTQLSVQSAVNATVSVGALFSRDRTASSGNGIVLRRARWLTGDCDATECLGTHGFGVEGQNHGSGWYAQAPSMFQTYSYGGGSPERLLVYAR